MAKFPVSFRTTRVERRRDDTLTDGGSYRKTGDG